MRRNSCLVTIAGNASSTRTGGAPSLASTPQTSVPVYASLERMRCTVDFNQCLPVEVGMPSPFSVLVMSRVLLPCRAIWKMRRITESAGGSSSSLGRFFAPSWIDTFL